MKIYEIYGVVKGSVYLGEWDGNTKEEAIENCEKNHERISFCHECSGQCEDPEFYILPEDVEEVER